MSDMLVLAFQTDSTRIATFMFANAGSNRSYRNIGVSDGHHDLSHHGDDPQKHAKIRQINRFHVSQFAYLLRRLKSDQRRRRHAARQLHDRATAAASATATATTTKTCPCCLAGRGGGTIDPGRHVRYEEETPMCNLFLSMLAGWAPRPPSSATAPANSAACDCKSYRPRNPKFSFPLFPSSARQRVKRRATRSPIGDDGASPG